MKEKNIFLMGLGTGLVIASIISLFSYNVLLKTNISSNNMDIITTTTTQTELFKEESSQVVTENSTETTTDNVTETTIKELELSSTPNLEITTDKPFELSTN